MATVQFDIKKREQRRRDILSQPAQPAFPPELYDSDELELLAPDAAAKYAQIAQLRDVFGWIGEASTPEEIVAVDSSIISEVTKRRSLLLYTTFDRELFQYLDLCYRSIKLALMHKLFRIVVTEGKMPKKDFHDHQNEIIARTQNLVKQFNPTTQERGHLLTVISARLFGPAASPVIGAKLVHFPLPSSAPNGEVYEKRPKGENAPDFIKRVYGLWLTGEFTRADLRKLDEKAEMGLRNWERKNGRVDFELPTKKQRNDALLDSDEQALGFTEQLARNKIKSSRKYRRPRSNSAPSASLDKK